MDQESVAATSGEGPNGVASPDELDDGLVNLRRNSDWTGRARTHDDAAASAYRAALGMATATLTAYDGGTAAHSDDVVTLCLVLAEQLGVRDRERAYLLAAAELHDIGKVGVPPQILSKPSALDPDEWDVVREHTVTGERILGAVPELAEVARIVRHCHERWDGDGYPDGLAGQQIPLCARIVFCADAFHAIRGDRPYRRGRSARAALAEVRKHSGTQFDPAVVTALATVAERLDERRRRGFSVHMGGRRSQRLAALLLTLAIGGGAMAATGVWGPTKGKASAEVDPEEGPAPAAVPAESRAAAAALDAARRVARDAASTRRREKARATVAPVSQEGEREGLSAPAPGSQTPVADRLAGGDAPGGEASPRRQSSTAPGPAAAPESRAPAGLNESESAPEPAPGPLTPEGDEVGEGDEVDEGGEVDEGDGGDSGPPGRGRGHGYGHDKGRGHHRGHDH